MGVEQREYDPHEEGDGVVSDRYDDFYVHSNGDDAADNELGVGDCDYGFRNGGGAEAGERAADAESCGGKNDQLQAACARTVLPNL